MNKIFYSVLTVVGLTFSMQQSWSAESHSSSESAEEKPAVAPVHHEHNKVDKTEFDIIYSGPYHAEDDLTRFHGFVQATKPLPQYFELKNNTDKSQTLSNVMFDFGLTDFHGRATPSFFKGPITLKPGEYYEFVDARQVATLAHVMGIHVLKINGEIVR
jgi:hypothetical protein